MNTFLKIFFFFLLITQICFAQWFQQTIGKTSWLHGVSFSDANNGTAVGVDGTILHTTNGGETWITQASGTNVLLTDVSFTDVNNGMVVGFEGTILRTIDGGTTWTPQRSGTTYYLHGVSLCDANNGTAVGGSGIILHTTNGGETWTSQISGTTNWLYGVSFSDANNGTAVGDDNGYVVHWTILRTTDGGQSWIRQLEGTNASLDAVSFIDNYYETAVGFDWENNYGVILRTTNGGQNWVSQLSGTNERLFGVSFTDANNGTVVGINGTILRTINGGVVPVELHSFTATANIKEVTLSWSTATELNNQGFEVQRKFGFNDFVTIGSVKGHGTTTSPNQYTFIDKPLDAGKYFYRLKQIDYGGKYEYSQVLEVNWSPFTTYKLEQNFSNPFNPTTTIGFGIPEKGNVRLSVLNILGEEIRVLLNEQMEAGYHLIDFNGSELSSGVYFYKIQVYPADNGAGNFIDTKKMPLLK